MTVRRGCAPFNVLGQFQCHVVGNQPKPPKVDRDGDQQGPTKEQDGLPEVTTLDAFSL